MLKKSMVVPAMALLCSLQLVHAAESFGARKAEHKAVFVMTNDAHRNEILSYERLDNGSLQPYDRFRTGGRGSGGRIDPLGSQGSLTLSEDRKFLFAVNAGSGQVSSFRVRGPRLELADVQATRGSAPVAVAQHDNLVYVLNFAGNSNVVGFEMNFAGELTPIHTSIRYLTTANSGASSLAFSPDGSFLLVTEKLTNNIDAFPVLPDGTLGTPVTTKDPAAGLFDLVFTPSGAVMVLEAGAATLTSFQLESSGALTPLTSRPTLGAASCWNVVSPDGHFVYTSNAGSANISGFSIGSGGALTALPGTIVGTYPAGNTNLDMSISGDGKFLYTLNAGSGTVGMFAIRPNGTLAPIGMVPAVTSAVGQNGIAAL